MIGYVFAGQGSQYEGMGKDLYDGSPAARHLFEQANEILGFSLTDVMFNGTAEDLRQTKVTQPALFVHAIAQVLLAGEDFRPAAVAGHSLGELSALVAVGTLSFEQGLRLVNERALAMQRACEHARGAMAAVIGLDDAVVEALCAEVGLEAVVPANYNCPGQLVISGTEEGVAAAVAKCDAAGGRTVMLSVGGAFHSPLMAPAREQLQLAIEATPFAVPLCPIYQNVDALPETDPANIKAKLIAQLTGAVRWTQTLQHMMAAGITEFVEVGGNGKVLQGFVKKIDRRFPTGKL